MKRVPDLIDVWFDSGAMPYAQWHFPFENEETFVKIILQILLQKVLTRPGDGFILCMPWVLLKECIEEELAKHNLSIDSSNPHFRGLVIDSVGLQNSCKQWTGVG